MTTTIAPSPATALRLTCAVLSRYELWDGVPDTMPKIVGQYGLQEQTIAAVVALTAVADSGSKEVYGLISGTDVRGEGRGIVDQLLALSRGMRDQDSVDAWCHRARIRHQLGRLEEMVCPAPVVKDQPPEPVESPEPDLRVLVDAPNMAILRCLNLRPTYQHELADIVPSQGPVDRRTIKRRLLEMASQGLVRVTSDSADRFQSAVILPKGAEIVAQRPDAAAH